MLPILFLAALPACHSLAISSTVLAPTTALTASGFFGSDGNGNFDSDFALDSGVHKYLAGTFTSAIPHFRGKNVTLTYSALSDLSGTYIIQPGSTVGPTTVNVTFQDKDTRNRFTFTGGIVCPDLGKAYTVMGEGKWTSSFA